MDRFAVEPIDGCVAVFPVRDDGTEMMWGVTPEECRDFIDSGRYEQYKNVIYSGLMCMASHTDDEKRIHSDFRKVFNLYESLKSEYFSNDNSFAYRSWGMSEDYKIAVQEGSNIVRIGTRIFGERDYTKSFTL